jgi:hypothetical protein
MATKARKKPETLYTSSQFRPYVTALGQLALAWNGLHETLSVLFSGVIGGENQDQLLAIWHAVNSDRAQRQMLIAAVTNNIREEIPQKYIDEIKWICGRATVLEDLRNDALHSPLWAYQRTSRETIIMPVIGLGHERAKKLFDKNLLADFRWCRDRSNSLREFSSALYSSLLDNKTPLPDRPAWLERPGTKPPKQRRPTQTTKRPRQPRSSLA